MQVLVSGGRKILTSNHGITPTVINPSMIRSLQVAQSGRAFPNQDSRERSQAQILSWGLLLSNAVFYGCLFFENIFPTKNPVDKQGGYRRSLSSWSEGRSLWLWGRYFTPPQVVHLFCCFLDNSSPSIGIGLD